jgi:hypothetical protein
MADGTLTQAVTADPLRVGLEVAGEYILPLPGGSNLVKGDFRQAFIHAGLGVIAGAIFGPIGMLVVSANSLSVALTERNLADTIDAEIGTAKGAPTATTARSAK